MSGPGYRRSLYCFRQHHGRLQQLDRPCLNRPDQQSAARGLAQGDVLTNVAGVIGSPFNDVIKGQDTMLDDRIINDPGEISCLAEPATTSSRGAAAPI